MCVLAVFVSVLCLFLHMVVAKEFVVAYVL